MQQQLLELTPDPLRGQIIDGDMPAQTRRVLVELKFEASGELHGAEDAQAVVGKGVQVNGAQLAASQIATAVERIEVFVGQRIPGDRVNREVAPAGGVGR